jgi:hypothetical protein
LSTVAILCLLTSPAAAQVEGEPPQTCRCLYGDYVPVIFSDSGSEFYYGISITNHTDVDFDSVEISFYESNGNRWSVEIADRFDPMSIDEKATCLLIENGFSQVELRSLNNPDQVLSLEPSDPSVRADSFGPLRSSMFIGACAEATSIYGFFSGTAIIGHASDPSEAFVALTEPPPSRGCSY